MREKNELRRVMKILRKSLSERQRDEYNNRIIGNVVDLAEYQQAEIILSYVTTQSEVDTISLILQAFSDHKRVAVPRVTGDTMEFYEITSLDDCKEGTFHIMEPVTKKMIHPEQEKQSLMIIPGLAFDLKMNRCGYGKGYYDKYLSAHADADILKIALAYDLQVVHEVPQNKNDIKMDFLITENRIYSSLMIQDFVSYNTIC